MNKLAYALLAFASIGIASAQKTAVINSQKAVLETAEIKKAQLDLEAKFKPRQDRIVQMQKDLQTIQSQLQSGKLNAAGEQELNAEGTKKQRDLQRLQQDLQDDVNLERNDILSRSGTRMQEGGEEDGRGKRFGHCDRHYQCGFLQARLRPDRRSSHRLQQNLSGKIVPGRCPVTWKHTERLRIFAPGESACSRSRPSCWLAHLSLA